MWAIHQLLDLEEYFAAVEKPCDEPAAGEEEERVGERGPLRLGNVIEGEFVKGILQRDQSAIFNELYGDGEDGSEFREGEREDAVGAEDDGDDGPAATMLIYIDEPVTGGESKHGESRGEEHVGTGPELFVDGKSEAP